MKSFHKRFISYFVCMYVSTCIPEHTCVYQVAIVGIDSLFLPCESPELRTHAWWRALLLAEPFHWSRCHILMEKQRH